MRTTQDGRLLWCIVLLFACGIHSWPLDGNTGAVSNVYRHSRRPLVLIDPDSDPKTGRLSPQQTEGSPDLPAFDRRVKKQKQGCTYPEQVHLTYWSSTSVLVSWATCDAVVGDSVAAIPTGKAVSIVIYGTASNRLGNTATAAPTSYVYDYRKVDKPSYASPLLHHVLLKDLTPGQTYFYRVLGTPDDLGAGSSNTDAPVASQLFNFTMPKGSFPLRLGVVADPGQTHNSSEVLQALIASQPDLVMLGGDFGYADDWLDATTRLPYGFYGTYTYQPKWDTWGRLYEPLLSHVPFMHCDGNHELERLPNGEQQKAYNYRYPVPTRGANSLPEFSAVTKVRPFHNLYYAVELPGVYKAIFLTSYSPNQTFSDHEKQYKWLKSELRKTDRTKTPWLLVMTHAPWYNSYAGHYKEAECFRNAYEPLLLEHQVDVMLHGHVHAYERTKPLADYKVDECGPVHITVGDGGNIEGLYKEFIDEIQPKPDFCSTPQVCRQFPMYQPQCCLSFQDGQYCPSKQSAWSAYREPSFGHGMLELLNATHAKWTWNKVQWPAWRVADQVMIIRGGQKKCGAGGKQAIQMQVV